MGNDDDQALKQFCQMLEDRKNRYIVSQPCKMTNKLVADNYQLSCARSRGTFNRLKKNANEA